MTINAKISKPIFATSNSIIRSNSKHFQAGGTMTMTHGKWTGRLIKRIHDFRNCGRWSGITIRQNKTKNIHIITIYRPTKGTSETSFYNQNKEILMQQEIETDPQKQFYTDLIKTIKAIKYPEDELIIMGDFNQAIEAPDLVNFIQELNLHNPIPNPPTRTYKFGSKCIDHIFITNGIKIAIQQSLQYWRIVLLCNMSSKH